jgi:hypothetical protein
MMSAFIESAGPLRPAASIVARRDAFHLFKLAAAPRTGREQLSFLCAEQVSARGALERPVLSNQNQAHDYSTFMPARATTPF